MRMETAAVGLAEVGANGAGGATPPLSPATLKFKGLRMPGKMRDPSPGRIASKVTSSLRMKPRGVMASLTVTARPREEERDTAGDAPHTDRPCAGPRSVASSDAIDSLAGKWDGPKTPKQDENQGSAGHDPKGCSPRRLSELEAGEPDDEGSFQETDSGIPPVLPLLQAEGDAGQKKSCGADATECSETACSEFNNSAPSSLEDAIAVEVGLSAQEYLEECFYVTEVSVLDKDKFDAVPEIAKGDFAIVNHLGKGSFSDVFEVTSKGARFPSSSPEFCDVADDKACHKSDDPLAGPSPSPPQRRPSTNARRQSGLSSSVCGSVIGRPPSIRKPTFALKCLRPQIRSDPEQFTIGAEDLVHETAILASVGEHPHIIKLHGRAAGVLADAFVLNDGYFILMEKLATTLPDRIELWRKDPSCRGPTVEKLGVVRDVAGAMAYLHSKRIIFRDLKPDNVGFSSGGVVKLFDFGFAGGLPEPTRQNPNGFLYERCGTPRFMAPEVGLEVGYGLKADVYSLGILLWEVCAMESPFADITCPDDFHGRVFERGERPPVAEGWPGLVKKTLERCWSANPVRRPHMAKARSALATACGGTEGRRSAARATRDRLRSSLSRLRSLDM